MTDPTQSMEAAAPDGAPAQDVAPLAWVIGEIRGSLGEAIKAAKGFLASKSDVDAIRSAREHVHQVTGALQLLDLRGAVLVTEAVEQLFTLWESKPGQCLPAAVRSVDAALLALRNYLDAVLAGQAVAPIRLYPYYRDVLLLLAAPRVHPADLLFPDLRRRPPFHQMEVHSFTADQLRIKRVMFEEGLARFLRNPDNAQARQTMRNAVADLEGVPQRGLARSFWWVVRALFDALESFQLPVDADLKRFLARLNQQLRRQIQGGSAVAERLLIDALYHVARADSRIERVAQVQELYGLGSLLPPDFEQATLTSSEGADIAALKEALNQCKLLWGQAVASNPPDMARFAAEVARAQTSAQRLGDPAPGRVLGSIGAASAKFAGLPAELRAVLGMEVATALLLLESGAEAGQQDQQFAQRADAMVERIGRAASGEALPEADGWINELARRAQERSSMDTVVAEMQTLLRDAELRLDRFFRNTKERGELAALAPIFEQVSGVLDVLGFEDPAQALRLVRDAVQGFVDPAIPADVDAFNRIAQNVGAVGFFVSTLVQQPQPPRGMFALDRATGVFTANMGMARTEKPVPEDLPEAVSLAGPGSPAPEAENVERSIERLMAIALLVAEKLAVAPDDKDALSQLEPVLKELSSDAELTDDAALRARATQAAQLLEKLRNGGGAAAAQSLLALLRPAVAMVPAPTAPMPASASAADRELHDVFVEEADEVLESVGVQLARLRRDPNDAATLTMARRAFHTLKGSSRMVGLTDFGEFAWSVEQCFNVWLAQEWPANDDLLALAAASADRMRDWIEALRSDAAAHIDASAFIHAAHVVRDGGSFTLPYTLAREEIADPRATTIEVTAAPPPVDDYAEESAQAPPGAVPPREELRRIGPLSISHGLYSVFLNESDECIRALAQEIGEWRYEPALAVSESIMRRAHTLAGISDTVGLVPVSAIVDPLDGLFQHLYGQRGHASARLQAPQFDTLERAIERVRGMLHQFAAGVYPEAAPLEAGALSDLLTVALAQSTAASAAEAQAAAPAALAEVPGPAPAIAPEAPPAPAIEVPALPEAPVSAPSPSAWVAAPSVEAPVEPVAGIEQAEAEQIEIEALAPLVQDEVDEQLLPVFAAEAHDLLPAIAQGLRVLAADPNQRDLARDLMRQLHTLKGSARMAGAMRLGEVVHEMETRIDDAMQLAQVPPEVVEDLQSRLDQALALFEGLGAGAPQEAAPGAAAPSLAISNLATTLSAVSGARATPGAGGIRAASLVTGGVGAAPARTAAATSFIRVRADVIDRLVDHAGEVSIARSKLEAEVGTLRASLSDLSENIQRLRSQLREVEVQADAQFQARSDQVAKQSSTFDPLEFDRYSRLQELTRLLAESVEDVALVQNNMVKGLQLADNDLGAQSRLTRELQQQLMQVRLVPFSNVSERLYRVARQAAKELDKRVNLNLIGAQTEIDRSLLEQMAGPFEHLVRNAIVHGLETPQARLAAGKPETGELRVEVRKEGNEIVVIFADDGAGLDLQAVRARAINAGLVTPERSLEERELIELIFTPGLSTATEVTELAGRGVGMDVVREQVSALGGRIAITSERGAGARFTLYLPMTLSIMQVVLASVGPHRYALPAAMVEQARRVRAPELLHAVQSGSIDLPEVGEVTLRPLSQLVGAETAIIPGEQYSVALLRLGDDRLAICADDLSANQEVVVKNVGPQVARLAGVLGATVLGNGQVVLIVNPVQLIARAPEPPQLDGAGMAAAGEPRGGAAKAAAGGATVLVVDDSLTVRRVTQRLLERNGYRTILAKDGVDAMRELQDHIPDVMLVDIEMPRMDGYDLTRNVRNGSTTRNIPIIMITSRTAEKHRRVAFEIGVNEYLGKPYREDELLELIRRYVEAARVARGAGAPLANA